MSDLNINDSTITLKQDFADEKYWRRLASKHGVRLPARSLPCTSTRYVRRFQKRLGLDKELVQEALGSLTSFCRSNRTWPAFAVCGLLLELADSVGSAASPED